MATKTLTISNCGNTLYTSLYQFARMQNESLSQLCCDFLFNFKQSSYIFLHPKNLQELHILLQNILKPLDNIAQLDQIELDALNILAYNNPSQAVNLLLHKYTAKKQKHSRLANIDYSLMHKVWRLFELRHAHVNNYYYIKKRLDKLADSVSIKRLHPKGRLHTITIYVPERLYHIVKQTCKAHHITFHSLFMCALLHFNTSLHIIPNKNDIAKLHHNRYQKHLIGNYHYYKQIKKSLHIIYNENLNKYIKSLHHYYIFKSELGF